MSKTIIKSINTFLEERDWHGRSPANAAKSVCIEAAELLEKFQWSDPSVAELKKDPEALEKIGREIADVLIYTYNLVDMLGLDAEELVKKKIELAAKKYPVEKVKGKLGRKEYQRIKEEYRVKGIN
jgi:NTP pyrophosphatase (non-canonical NTP hydrolase)